MAGPAPIQISVGEMPHYTVSVQLVGVKVLECRTYTSRYKAPWELKERGPQPIAPRFSPGDKTSFRVESKREFAAGDIVKVVTPDIGGNHVVGPDVFETVEGAVQRPAGDIAIGDRTQFRSKFERIGFVTETEQ